jgi:L-threonylcarbamoyladenylate synthase
MMCSPQSAALISQALEALRAGGVIAIPTDTVYGLAAALDQPAAIERIYALKGRDDGKPLPILASDLSSATRLSSSFPEAARRLTDRFWPGPLTVVVPASPAVPAGVLRGGSTVGLRMPAHPVALALLAAAGGALAVTSANRSGDPETVCADEVHVVFGETVDVIVDGGCCPGGQVSTVVEVEAGELRVLRAGALSEADLLAALRDAPWR